MLVYAGRTMICIRISTELLYQPLEDNILHLARVIADLDAYLLRPLINTRKQQVQTVFKLGTFKM